MDVKQFPITRQGTVRVFADSMGPITDPIIGMSCYNGFQMAAIQCQYTVSGNKVIRARLPFPSAAALKRFNDVQTQAAAGNGDSGTVTIQLEKINRP